MCQVLAVADHHCLRCILATIANSAGSVTSSPGPIPFAISRNVPLLLITRGLMFRVLLQSQRGRAISRGGLPLRFAALAHVGCWHKADMRLVLSNVRFGRCSGDRPATTQCRLLTQNRRRMAAPHSADRLFFRGSLPTRSTGLSKEGSCRAGLSPNLSTGRLHARIMFLLGEACLLQRECGCRFWHCGPVG
jgi:hypothetical protein